MWRTAFEHLVDVLDLNPGLEEIRGSDVASP